ncbi:MAG: hypothetical protein LBQ51_05085 [Desulfovibrio sp.]|jgi:hypothetical protein|nr:hypothetical protein [Desulfovibrio sp.]
MLDAVSSALSWSFFQQYRPLLLNKDDNPMCCGRFIQSQIRSLPDYLRPAFTLLAWTVNFLSLLTERGLFCRLAPDARARVIARWEKLPGPTRDFTLFYKVLVVYHLFSCPDGRGSA